MASLRFPLASTASLSVVGCKSHTPLLTVSMYFLAEKRTALESATYLLTYLLRLRFPTHTHEPILIPYGVSGPTLSQELFECMVQHHSLVLEDPNAEPGEQAAPNLPVACSTLKPETLKP